MHVTQGQRGPELEVKYRVSQKIIVSKDWIIFSKTVLECIHVIIINFLTAKMLQNCIFKKEISSKIKSKYFLDVPETVSKL